MYYHDNIEAKAARCKILISSGSHKPCLWYRGMYVGLRAHIVEPADAVRKAVLLCAASSNIIRQLIGRTTRHVCSTAHL
jgi:hypothetical protein